MNRSRVLAGIAMGAVAAGAYRAVAKRDWTAVEADPAWRELRRSLSPDVVRVRRGAPDEIVVDVYGPADAPTVVLAHGWVCTAAFWARQIQALRDDYRVIAYDARGHGRSAPAPDGDYSIEALADDLDAVLAACVPDGQQCVLVGHSMGAMTIVAWAQRHRASLARVAAAALVNTGLDQLIGESAVAPLPARLRVVQETVGRAFLSAPGKAPGGPGPISHRAVRYVALSPNASPGEVAFCERMVLSCAAPARAGCGRTIAGLRLLDAVEHLDVPTAVVAGKLDRLTPPAHAERLLERLPQPAAELIELSESGHMGPIEDPAAVTGVIRDLADRYLTAKPGDQRRSAELLPSS